MVILGTEKELKMFHNECGKCTCSQCVLYRFCAHHSFNSKACTPSQIETIVSQLDKNEFEKINPILIIDKEEDK